MEDVSFIHPNYKYNIDIIMENEIIKQSKHLIKTNNLIELQKEAEF